MILTIKKAVILTIALFGLSLPGLGAPFLFNTGVDDDGDPLPYAANTSDLHWTITSSPYGAIDAVLADPGAFPISTGQWIANSATTSWIGPANQPTGGSGGVATGGPNGGNVFGTYVYETVFDLSTFFLNTVSLSGSYAVDNRLSSILVNGVSIGAVGAGGFSSLTNFNIPAGGSLFNSGNNTLTFVTQNGVGPGNDEFGPTGLYAQFTLSGIQVPELDAASATVPLTLLVGAFLILVDRRRKGSSTLA